MKIFAERLKEARLVRGLTQKQLAQHVGVQVQAIQKYEAQKQIPKLDTLIALAQEVHRTPDWLCGFRKEAWNKKRSITKAG